MKISKNKREKIFEQILELLYSVSPRTLFTSHIAREIARDDEFVKNLLLELKNKNLVNNIKKNSNGVSYIRRIKWGLSETAYRIYKDHQ